MFKKIKGVKISLRQMNLSDAAAIQKHTHDRDIARNSRRSQPFTLEQAEAFVRQARKLTRSGRACWFGIEDRQSAAIAGAISLRDIDHSAKTAKVGFWLGRKSRRHGYTLEAVRLILGFAFRKLRLHRVYAAVHSPNVASIRLLEKAGFQFEGCSREADVVGGRRCDVLWYGILKKEFVGRRAGRVPIGQ